MEIKQGINGFNKRTDFTNTEKKYKQIFLKAEKNRYCVYCGVSEEACKKFFEKMEAKGIPSTRGGRRGYRLEVDRIDSTKPYAEGNCCLVCYVCNNAKSNFINSREMFQPIADGIKKFWEIALLY
ncbi:MAG: hypothetical protein LBG92_11500 [Prevotellaceae bacterium]|jgi:hypothetical protein|nr:hypothetical protein [Prevotellaceae bacterium]